MKKYINILTIGLVAVFALGSCTDKFDALEPTTPYTDEDLNRDGVELITIADLKRYFWDAFPYHESTGQNPDFVEITDNVAIKGKVISTDWYGNVYRSLYIQDETGAMEIKVGLTGMFLKYPPGTIVYVKAQNLILGNYRYNLSLGAKSINPKYSNGYLDLKETIRETIKCGEYVGIESSDITELTAANITAMMSGTYPVTVRRFDANGEENGTETIQLTFNQRYNGSLMKFTGIRSHWGSVSGDDGYNDEDVFPQYLTNPNTGDFAEGYYVSYTYAQTIAAWQAYENSGGAEPAMPRPGTDSPQDPGKPFIAYPTWAFRNHEVSYYGTSLWQLGGRNFSIRTSGYSNFALRRLPEHDKTADITAILTRYASSGGGFRTYQILLNSVNDVVMSN